MIPRFSKNVKNFPEKLQEISLDFTGNGLGQTVTEHDQSGILVRCGVALDVVLNFLLQCLCGLGASIISFLLPILNWGRKKMEI